MDLTNYDDASLLRLIAHQHSEALGVLYDRYGRLVYSIALNSVGNTQTAEEIVQDVFTRVWEKAATYNMDLAKVSTWLVSITRNRAIDELRQAGSRPLVQNVDWAEMGNVPDRKVPDPETLAEAHWQEKTVREAVSVLPPEQRQVLALAYFKGYTHSEIAEAVGQPLGTVKTRIRLAMRTLREMLFDQVAENG